MDVVSCLVSSCGLRFRISRSFSFESHIFLGEKSWDRIRSAHIGNSIGSWRGREYFSGSALVIVPALYPLEYLTPPSVYLFFSLLTCPVDQPQTPRIRFGRHDT